MLVVKVKANCLALTILNTSVYVVCFICEPLSLRQKQEGNLVQGGVGRIISPSLRKKLYFFYYFAIDFYLTVLPTFPGVERKALGSSQSFMLCNDCKRIQKTSKLPLPERGRSLCFKD